MPETITFSFEVEGIHYGFAEIPPNRDSRFFKWPRSTAFFCPSCSNIWARAGAVTDQSEALAGNWTVAHRRCPSCGGSRTVNDILPEHNFLDIFPQALLEYELEVALKEPMWPEYKLWC